MGKSAVFVSPCGAWTGKRGSWSRWILLHETESKAGSCGMRSGRLYFETWGVPSTGYGYCPNIGAKGSFRLQAVLETSMEMKKGACSPSIQGLGQSGNFWSEH